MSSFEKQKTPKNKNNNNIKPKNTILTAPRWPSSRTISNSLSPSPSLSSNSSSCFISFSNEEISPPQNPSQRIPFSWETIPGIPKQQIIIKRLNSSMNNNSTTKNMLPLPPTAVPFSCNATKPYCKKNNHFVSRNKDPFFAALVECSKRGDVKDEHRDNNIFGSISKGLAKGLRHRSELVNFSCKNTCCVDESLVFLPREHPRRISYGMVRKNQVK